METLYLKLKPGDISKYVLFSGDPQRVEMVKKYLKNPRHISYSREFNTYTGEYKGVPITITSTGMGAPSCAVAVEEMYQCGMEVAIRMGTVMGLADDMLGKIFIPTACIRDEGTSKTYVRKSYPAVSDFDLVCCMEKSSEIIGRKIVKGINCTMDGFYSQMKDSRFSKEMERNHQKTFDELKKINCLGVDMESSLLLTLTNLMGIKGCVVTMTTVLENLKDFLKGEERTKSEEDICLCALEGIVLYKEKEKK